MDQTLDVPAIFMTSNLGASEMSALTNPRLGFNSGEAARKAQNGEVDDKISGKMNVTVP